VLPSVVSPKNPNLGISISPAGIEITVRIPGIIRPRNTAQGPCRRSVTCALSRSSSVIPSHRPNRAQSFFVLATPKARASSNHYAPSYATPVYDDSCFLQDQPTYDRWGRFRGYRQVTVCN
jgi:hypothetical protein